MRFLGLAAFAGYLFRQQDLLLTIWQPLSEAEPQLWLAGVLGLLGSLALTAWRLQQLVFAGGHRTSWLALYLDVLRGTAVSAVTLMGVGDGYRAHRLSLLTGAPLKGSLAIVFVDRFLGLALLAGVGTTMLVVQGREFNFSLPLGLNVRWLVGVALLFVSIGVVALASRHRGSLNAALQAVSKRRGHLLTALGSGLLCVACWLFSIHCLARAIALGTDLSTLCYVAPLVALATLLPVSIGGLGVRETGYALLLRTDSADAGRAAALGLLQYSTILVVALLGAVLLLHERNRREAGTPSPSSRLDPAKATGSRLAAKRRCRTPRGQGASRARSPRTGRSMTRRESAAKI